MQSNEAPLAYPPVLMDFVNKLETFNIPAAQVGALRAELALLTAVAEVALAEHPRVPVCVQFGEMVEKHRHSPFAVTTAPQTEREHKGAQESEQSRYAARPNLRGPGQTWPQQQTVQRDAVGSRDDDGSESILGKWPREF